MSDERERGWKQFQGLRFDKKQTLKRLRRAETVSVRHAHKFVLKRWRNVRDVRHIVIIWLIAVSCLIGAAGMQLYWDQRSYQTTAGALGGTYAEAITGPIGTLNPLFADTPAAEAVGKLVFSSLLSHDKTGNLNYDLAKKVTVSKDQKTYTVDLRSDVLWHDGKKLTADDVIFTVELLKDTSTRTLIRGWDDIKVQKKGDYVVSFSLKSPYAPFESALTFPIVPKHILGEVAHDAVREHGFSNNPVGSGPFKFRLLQDTDVVGKRIVHLVANDQYYNGAPKLARFQVLVVPNDEAMLSALRLNEVNGASGVTRNVLGQLPEKRYEVHTQRIQSGVYALLNNDSEVLSSKAVRLALQKVTNTEEIRKKVGGDVSALDLPYTGLQIHGNVPKAPVYDLKAAGKILDKAGWKLDGKIRKKKGKELRLSVVTTKSTDYERALETLIGQWRQLGIAIDEKVIDAADPTQNFVQSTLQPRAYDVLLYQLTMGRDPDVFAYWHSSQAVARGLNLANYSNPLADDILSSARASETDALRNAKHLAFAKQWLEDAPAIGLYQSVTHSGVAHSVKGMSPSAELVSPAQRYGEARYWTVGERTVYRTP